MTGVCALHFLAGLSVATVAANAMRMPLPGGGALSSIPGDGTCWR
jgi:hypothetical protein